MRRALEIASSLLYSEKGKPVAALVTSPFEFPFRESVVKKHDAIAIAVFEGVHFPEKVDVAGNQHDGGWRFDVGPKRVESPKNREIGRTPTGYVNQNDARGLQAVSNFSSQLEPIRAAPELVLLRISSFPRASVRTFCTTS